jgi:hypothetical protein
MKNRNAAFYFMELLAAPRIARLVIRSSQSEAEKAPRLIKFTLIELRPSLPLSLPVVEVLPLASVVLLSKVESKYIPMDEFLANF